MQATDMNEAKLQELRQELSDLSACLPKSIDLAALSRFKAPGKVLMLRESLIWRAEELGRNALASLDAGNFVTAALLTRAVMETTGAIVLLHRLVADAINKGFSDGLEEKLTGFLTGSKIWDDIDGAIHVNDMLREVAKIIPGFFEEHYAMLSEFAHPNWSGTLGSFGIIIEEELMVKFARGGRSPETQHGLIKGRLAGSIGLFTGYYKELGELLIPFSDAVENFHTTKAGANEVS